MLLKLLFMASITYINNVKFMHDIGCVYSENPITCISLGIVKFIFIIFNVYY